MEVAEMFLGKIFTEPGYTERKQWHETQWLWEARRRRDECQFCGTFIPRMRKLLSEGQSVYCSKCGVGIQ